MDTRSTQRSRKAARPTRAADTVRRHREKMRAQGMRLVQYWVPDTSTPEFQAQARRQSLLASRKDRGGSILSELDEIVDDVTGWTP
jgi:hypothetical protein